MNVPMSRENVVFKDVTVSLVRGEQFVAFEAESVNVVEYEEERIDYFALVRGRRARTLHVHAKRVAPAVAATLREILIGGGDDSPLNVQLSRGEKAMLLATAAARSWRPTPQPDGFELELVMDVTP